ncbi:BA75_01398T0 [Komagataella pastoris]|uniref:BA75_01398T0 n=1 Tax=Komagataella pastoris TaxID=4922 RepID=A0A1B2J5J2_PICPA|nr:BA75_01398T0 [Komagataella pastoris]
MSAYNSELIDIEFNRKSDSHNLTHFNTNFYYQYENSGNFRDELYSEYFVPEEPIVLDDMGPPPSLSSASVMSSPMSDVSRQFTVGGAPSLNSEPSSLDLSELFSGMGKEETVQCISPMSIENSRSAVANGVLAEGRENSDLSLRVTESSVGQGLSGPLEEETIGSEFITNVFNLDHVATSQRLNTASVYELSNRFEHPSNSSISVISPSSAPSSVSSMESIKPPTSTSSFSSFSSASSSSSYISPASTTTNNSTSPTNAASAGDIISTTTLQPAVLRNSIAESKKKNHTIDIVTETGERKKISDSRLSLPELSKILNLANNQKEASIREKNILNILQTTLGFPLGLKTWIRDTSSQERDALIDQLYINVQQNYNYGYSKEILEIIIRRASYYMMQGRLRRERRAMRKKMQGRSS